MEPLTREEIFLAKMAGEDIETPEALTRKEEYMDKIAEKINQGGGSGEATKIDTIKARTTGSVTAATITNNSYEKDGVAYIDIIYEATAGGSVAPYEAIEGLPVPEAENETINFPAMFYGGGSYGPGGSRIIGDKLHILSGGVAPGVTHYIHGSYVIKK